MFLQFTLIWYLGAMLTALIVYQLDSVVAENDSRRILKSIGVCILWPILAVIVFCKILYYGTRGILEFMVKK